MKKIILSSLILGAATLLSANQILGLVEQDTINKIKELPIVKKIDKLIIEDARFDGELYIVNVLIGKDKRHQKMYVSKSMKYLIFGNVINSSSGNPLVIPKDISILKGKEVFTYGTGKDEYYVFTDPECPYCKKFEENLPSIKDKVKIHFLLYPLSFHKNAKKQSLFLLSQGKEVNKFDALLNIDSKNYNKEYTKEIEEILKENINLGNKLKVEGTPAIIDTNGLEKSWVDVLQKYNVDIKF